MCSATWRNTSNGIRSRVNAGLAFVRITQNGLHSESFPRIFSKYSRDRFFTMRKIPKCYLISRCGNSVERHSFRRVSGNLLIGYGC